MEHEKKIVNIIRDAIQKAAVKSEKITGSTRKKVKEVLKKSKPTRMALEEVAEDAMKGFSIAAKDTQLIARKAAKKILGVMKEVRANTGVITASTLKGVKEGVHEIQQRKTRKISAVSSTAKPEARAKKVSQAVKSKVKKVTKKSAVKATKKVVKKATVKKPVKKKVKKVAKK